MEFMEIKKIAIAALLLLSSSANAGLYIDMGIGYIEEIEVEVRTGNFVSILNAPIRGGFLVFRGGYRYKNWHNELETIGNQERTFNTFKSYYRMEWE